MAYKYLVIVESPAKGKTIERYLGKNYKVVASKGHVRDLPKSRMGIDFENNYEPDYITIRGKGPVIKDLKKYAKKAEKIFLAADPDREGEAIAWHIGHALKLDEAEENRVIFNEITKEAVKGAFKNPRAIDKSLVDAQQARRVLDRVVGYEISPILWKKVKSGLSAGRVQSVALKIIIDREKEIRNFEPEEYWSIKGDFKKSKKEFEAAFHGVDSKKVDLSNQEDVTKVLDKIDKDSPWLITKIKRSKRNRNPQKPFTTSTLQQDAANRLNFRTNKTMQVAQQLYEGVSIQRNQTVGLITYMRTDSSRISNTARNEAVDFIEEEYGKEYVGVKKATSKSNNAQDAHEAVRPTKASRTPESIKKYLSKDQYRLYQLIWNRFMASQMKPAVYNTMRVDLEQNGVNFRANGSQLAFAGFTKVYKDSSAQKDNILPDLEEGERIDLVKLDPKQHFTQPPARYSEATLVRALEENGVGRPSTYAPTLNTLRRRYYVSMKNRRFEPTELGEIVNELITEYFPQIVDANFTAEMEERLDEIEDGKQDWIELIDSFYRPFHKEIEKAEEEMEEIEIKDEPAGFDCELCGHDMVIKMGRYGKFYACSNFPECRNTKAILKKIGVTCPTCDKGEVVERKTKSNRVFFGCERYPDCDFSSWDKPVGRDCPKCEKYLVEKRTRKQVQVVCSNCDYEEEPVK